VTGQNGSGQSGTDIENGMDKMAYGQNGMDKMARTEWYGQNNGRNFWNRL